MASITPSSCLVHLCLVLAKQAVVSFLHSSQLLFCLVAPSDAEFLILSGRLAMPVGMGVAD
jgi:hypothetical protein